jgi:hypothetical protein
VSTFFNLGARFRRMNLDSSVTPDLGIEPGLENEGFDPSGLLKSISDVKEAPPGFEPGMEVLQTSALPLGYGAATRSVWLDLC